MPRRGLFLSLLPLGALALCACAGTDDAHAPTVVVSSKAGHAGSSAGGAGGAGGGHAGSGGAGSAAPAGSGGASSAGAPHAGSAGQAQAGSGGQPAAGQGGSSAGSGGASAGQGGASAGQGGASAGGTDAGGSAGSASACLASMQSCADGGGCCEGMTCGKTSLGQVCCGNEGAPCATASGEDCCGALECVSGHCTNPAPACLKATQACDGGGCCDGLTCGKTSLGQVCCGNAGAPCATASGEDCCGALECVSGFCGGPPAGSSCAPVLSECTEAAIVAAAKGDALAYVQRALDWVHSKAPYSQVPQSKYGGYRTDCSGLVAMAWGLPPPGETTYSYAGGPWDDHSSFKLGSFDNLAIGDATNYPGDPDAGTGHIRLFAGWLNSAHTSYCSIEEYDYGHPAEIRSHTLDKSVYLPIRHKGFSPDTCTP